MKTWHDILRDNLLKKAGLADIPKPLGLSLSEIERKQWNSKFERLMRNRLIMGALRYGFLEDQIGSHAYDNVKSIFQRLEAYLIDHNREHLVDVIEFTVHPEYPFNSSDDGIHTPKKEI